MTPEVVVLSQATEALSIPLTDALPIRFLADACVRHPVDGSEPLAPEFVTPVLSEMAADDAIFTVDTGMTRGTGATCG